jgi:hypothetical protein
VGTNFSSVAPGGAHLGNRGTLAISTSGALYQWTTGVPTPIAIGQLWLSVHGSPNQESWILLDTARRVWFYGNNVPLTMSDWTQPVIEVGVLGESGGFFVKTGTESGLGTDESLYSNGIHLSIVMDDDTCTARVNGTVVPTQDAISESIEDAMLAVADVEMGWVAASFGTLSEMQHASEKAVLRYENGIDEPILQTSVNLTVGRTTSGSSTTPSIPPSTSPLPSSPVAPVAPDAPVEPFPNVPSSPADGSKSWYESTWFIVIMSVIGGIVVIGSCVFLVMKLIPRSTIAPMSNMTTARQH